MRTARITIQPIGIERTHGEFGGASNGFRFWLKIETESDANGRISPMIAVKAPTIPRAIG
jgi:hypothetical protein